MKETPKCVGGEPAPAGAVVVVVDSGGIVVEADPNTLPLGLSEFECKGGVNDEAVVVVVGR